MNYKIYKNKGLTGLSNLGNTCFINSAMQALSHTYELNNLLNKLECKINNNIESPLLTEWIELKNIMWSENCTVSPKTFIKTIQSVSKQKGLDNFIGYQQNDLPEFLLFVIDCFHMALSREVNMNISGKVVNKTDKLAVECFKMIKNIYSNEYSEIWDLFYGIHVSQIISIEDNSVLSNSPEPYFIINLPIPSNVKTPTLIDCFDLYHEGEILQDDNAWYNEKTKQKQPVKKQISYWSFPKILVIDVKRFNSNNKKNQVLIDFPLTNLDLSKYMIGYKTDKCVYDLYGICNHSGSVLGGHYTSFIKNANGKWYHFNDTIINEVTVLENLISPKAYCFFYRKRKI
jgi:ubiquitin C-terminal hydrolase